MQQHGVSMPSCSKTPKNSSSDRKDLYEIFLKEVEIPSIRFLEENIQCKRQKHFVNLLDDLDLRRVNRHVNPRLPRNRVVTAKLYCVKCNTQCRNQEELSSHEKSDKLMDCLYCAASLCTKDTLNDHRKKVHGIIFHTRRSCRFCSKPTFFKTANGCRSHNQKFHGSLPVRCIYCSFTFGSDEEREAHECQARLLAGMYNHKCTNCGRNFPYACSLRNHHKKCLKKDEKGRIVPPSAEANESSSTESSDRIKKKEKNSSLKRKRDLRHLEGTRLLKCEKCEKSFLYYSTLTKHEEKCASETEQEHQDSWSRRGQLVSESQLDDAEMWESEAEEEEEEEFENEITFSQRHSLDDYY